MGHEAASSHLFVVGLTILSVPQDNYSKATKDAVGRGGGEEGERGTMGKMCRICVITENRQAVLGSQKTREPRARWTWNPG